MPILKAPCAYCSEVRELRPYGREGARICFECGTKPENEETTKSMVRQRLEHAEFEGCGVSVLSGGAPRPHMGEYSHVLANLPTDTQ